MRRTFAITSSALLLSTVFVSNVAFARSPRLPSFFHHGSFPRVWVAIDMLKNAVNDLQNQIENIQLIPGPQGPAGPQGPKGDTGNGSSLPVVCPDCQLTNYDEDDFGDRWKGKDLSHAYLPGVHMSTLNFHGTNFSYANLQGAGLALGDFSDANLSHANLSCRHGICLTGGGNDEPTVTNLKLANLAGADLSYANLRGAIVAYATGTPSSIVGTIWTDAVCPDQTLANDNGGTCDGHFLP